MTETFPNGKTYIVDRREDIRGVGRRLHFVLPNGLSKWVNIGNEADTRERRDMIAAHLKDGKRYVKGAQIGPK